MGSYEVLLPNFEEDYQTTIIQKGADISPLFFIPPPYLFG